MYKIKKKLKKIKKIKKKPSGRKNREARPTALQPISVITRRVVAGHDCMLSGFDFTHQLDFSGKHSELLQLLHEGYTFTFPPLSSVYRQILIDTTELRQSVDNEIAQA